MIKRRRPLSPLLLSILPGLGQIYNGQPLKGLIFVSVEMLVPVMFGLTGILNNLSGLVALLISSVLFFFYRMADGFVHARRRVNYELKPYNKWYVYLSLAVVFILIRTFADMPATTGIQTFKIPGVSMSPTMQPGDMVVASLTYYNNNPIRQGDIVIFNSPESEIWVFRVIGLPGDSIKVKDGMVYINSELNSLISQDEYLLDNEAVVEYEEQINPTKKIRTLRYKEITLPGTPKFVKIKVPDNEYFLMGDNRDNSPDSRFIGTIKKDDIPGRITYNYWGNTPDRINIDFMKN